jgi:hypothetical protein
MNLGATTQTAEDLGPTRKWWPLPYWRVVSSHSLRIGGIDSRVHRTVITLPPSGSLHTRAERGYAWWNTESPPLIPGMG